MSGASWGHEGVIVFSDGGELFRVPAGGGDPKPLGNRADGENGRFWPQFLPDGRRYLYLSQSVRAENRGIYVASVASEERRRVAASDRNATYSAGHLLVVRGDALLAQAFDADRLELSGEAFSVIERVALTGGGLPGAHYSVSANGVLAWHAASALESMQLTWFDRSGKKLGTLGEPAAYSNPALSPDEKSLAVGRWDPQVRTRDLWVFDLVRGISRRLTFDPADDLGPTWSPDGAWIGFTSDRRGVRELYRKLANGAGEDELLLESKESAHLEDWSADGRFLIYNYHRGGTPSDLVLLPVSLAADRKPIPFLATDFEERMGQFAPNGRWIAYCSNETGRIEAYVKSLSADGGSARGQWQVSTAGGIEPRWRGDGKELFYVSGSTLMAVGVKTDGASFEAGVPEPLFEFRLLPEIRRNRYVATRDGQRFLVNATLGQASEPINVRVNWLPAKR